MAEARTRAQLSTGDPQPASRWLWPWSGTPSAATAVARFERVWWMVALTGLVVSFTSSFLRRPTAVRSTEPAAALTTASAH